MGFLDNILGNKNAEKNSKQETTLNFKNLDELMHGGQKEILLTNHVCFNSSFLGNDKSYVEGITVDMDNIIIDGKGFEINAQDNAKIFDVKGKNITIKNITFKNGNDMKCSKTEGGVIYVHKNASCLFNNCEFIQNKARYGGAIFNNGEIRIENSTFTKNTTEGNGGAIYNHGTMEIINSNLIENTSKAHGGALLNIDTGTITNTKINNNIAESDGGAISNLGELRITGSEISKNKAKRGGAINNSGGKTTIKEVQFYSNRADYGGAIQHQSVVGTPQGTIIGNLEITNSKFEDNLPKSIFSHDDKNMEIIDCEIDNSILPLKEKEHLIPYETPVCDVCNKKLDIEKSYFVPNEIFYHSPKYRQWNKEHFPASESNTQFEQRLAIMEQQDTTEGSAVCEDCIPMFR